jgi:hypothetical protein
MCYERREECAGELYRTVNRNFFLGFWDVSILTGVING